VSQYKQSSQNPCDFLAFNSGYLWLLECKETKDGTLNFSKVPQLERLCTYTGLEAVLAYIII